MSKDYGYTTDSADLSAWVKRILNSNKTFAFDIEAGYTGEPAKKISTTLFHPRWKMAGFSFSDDPDWARYIPVGHDSGENMDETLAARLLWTLLQTGRGVPHNAMYELQGLSRWFREVLSDDPFFGKAVRESQGLFPVLSDTMIEASMSQRYQPLSAGQGVGVGLKGLVKHIFGHEMTNFTDLFPDLKRGESETLRFNVLELDERSVEYACEDSAWTLALHLLHYPMVKDNLMFQVEIKLLPVLCEMEIAGLVLDWDEYERQEKIVGDFKDALNEEIQADLSTRLGELVNVNFNSPKQVAELLYDKLELPVQYNKKTKKPTTDEKAMTYLANKTSDPGLLKILEWRGVAKLLSSYITKYLNDLRYDPTGRARPSHNQLGAGTGRFSVDGVSYQQWPKTYHFELATGEALDLNYRNFLTAPENFRIVGFDFAQVEMRILAGVVGEKAMLEAFARGVDLHKQTASVMFKVPLDEVTPKQRQAAKGLNFGILYGQGAEALAEILGISKDEALELLQDYFDGFPKLRSWMNNQVLAGRAQREVSTPFGRRFHVWNYDESESIEARAEKISDKEKRDSLRGLAKYIYAEGDRLCVNAPIQGGAADYLKIGMVRAAKAIKDSGLEDKIILVMTVHDALEFYVHESITTQQVIDLINPMVSFPVKGFPEIRADWHEGKRWGEVLEINLDADKKITGYEYEIVLPDKRKFEWKGETAQEGLDWMKNVLPELISQPAEKSEEVSEDSDLHILIALAEPPLDKDWKLVTEYLSRAEGDSEVIVKLGERQKALSFKVPGTEEFVARLNELLPTAEVSLKEFDKAPF